MIIVQYNGYMSNKVINDIWIIDCNIRIGNNS